MESSSSKQDSRKPTGINYLDLSKGDELQKCYKEIEHLKMVNKQLIERYDETVSIIKAAVSNLTTLGPTLTPEELNEVFTQLNEVAKKL